MIHVYKSTTRTVQVPELDGRFVPTPVILRIVDLDEESEEIFSSEMAKAHSTGQSLIPVVIGSFGGDVYSLMSIVDILKSSKLPVATIIEGKAMSAGIVLAAYGTPGMRYCSPSSTIMIHDISTVIKGKTEEIMADARETERLNEIFLSMLDTAAGKESGYFFNLLCSKGRANLYFIPEDAKKHGLIDIVGMPVFETTVAVTDKLVLEK